MFSSKCQECMDLQIKLANVSVILPATKRQLFRIRDLTIPFGTHVLIRGSSGKGKTTLLHLMAGLFLPSEGYVYLGEQKMNSLSDEERSHLRRRHFGLVFQKLNLMDHLTPLENVLLGLPAGKSGAEETAKKALKALHMLDHAQARTAYLSVGEQQRVAVARVVAAAPNIIFADEPTSSLDDSNADAVMRSLFEVAQGKTLVVVSHDHRLEKKFATSMDFKEVTST